MKFFVFLLLTLLSVSAVFAGPYGEYYAASCRVGTSGAVGSGCTIAHNDGFVFVATNYHVAGTSKNVTCEFWNGTAYQKVRGAVVQASTRSRGIDVSIVAIPESQFEWLPVCIPLAGNNAYLKKGDSIFTIGCPGGRKQDRLITGKFVEYDRNGVILYYTPSPENGRSGSPIFNPTNGTVVGICNLGTDGMGGAASSQAILNTFSKNEVREVGVFRNRGGRFGGGGGGSPVGGEQVEDATPINSPCPGGNCQNGNCPITNVANVKSETTVGVKSPRPIFSKLEINKEQNSRLENLENSSTANINVVAQPGQGTAKAEPQFPWVFWLVVVIAAAAVAGGFGLYRRVR